MILYFLRHGKAGHGDASDPNDHARELTDAGVAELHAAAPLWRVSLSDALPGTRPVKASDVGQNCGTYRDFTENIGIVGTPVIDPATQTLFVVARTKESSGFVQRFHALDITTGAARPNSPVVIRASIPGTGAASANGVITFDPEIHNQRGSLLPLRSWPSPSRRTAKPAAFGNRTQGHPPMTRATSILPWATGLSRRQTAGWTMAMHF